MCNQTTQTHLENFIDVKLGDEIECYELIEIAQKLELQP